MPEAAATVPVTINGKAVRVKQGSSVASAVLAAGQFAFRHSVSNQPRGPVCGMGICMECRLTIDGLSHQKSCQIICQEGMVIETT